MKPRKYVVGGSIVLVMFLIALRVVHALQQKMALMDIFESLALPLVILAILLTNASKPNNPPD
jgi:hypothetical protein